MMKFRSKLLLTIVSLIGFAVIGLGAIFVHLIEKNSFSHFEDHMQSHAGAVVQYIEEHGGLEAVDEDAKDSFTLLQDHLAILSQKAAVIYSNNPAANLPMDIYSDITAYRTGGYERLDGDKDLYYFWEPIKDTNGTITGYVVMYNTFIDKGLLQGTSQIVLIGAIILFFLIVIVTTSKLATNFIKPVEDATNAATELAKGNYRVRTLHNPVKETKSLSSSINILARNLQEMETSWETEREKLSTLIEHIGSGVLLIDSKGTITLMNRVYKQLFAVSSKSFLGHPHYEVLPHQEVEIMIEEIFITEKSIKRQMLLPLGIERRHFEVYGAPIIGTNDDWKGIVVVFHDITELKKLEQVRQDFVANVSHELRTPITSIKGFTETLLDGELTDEKTVRNFLTIILNESDRLQMLVQDLLDLSKIERQEFRLDYTNFDLNDLMAEIDRLFARKAEKKSLRFKTTYADKEINVWADEHRVKQIFINLISNAIKYTPEGGSVEVIVSEDETCACIEVKDSGIGIEEKEIPRIFERFYRVDRARSRNSGGTGLGLAIVKHLVEAHNGKMEVKSRPGVGTSFIVKLHKYS